MDIGDWSADSGEVYFIAEAGVNHNGDVAVAKRLVDTAVDAGADAVKVQTFRADRLVTESAPTASYQEESTDETSQRELLQNLELTEAEHRELQRYCDRQGITFLSTPFGPETASFLDELDVPAIKIGSGDLTNHPLLRRIAEFGRPMIISTGMSTQAEVRDAYNAIRKANPTVPVALLHCVSAYPTEIDEVNLRAIQTLHEEFDITVGFSDHTKSVEMPALSVTAGARIVEKHFTLDRSMDGPDHAASLEPPELDSAVSLVRDAERALGDGVKEPVPAELETRGVARKALYATSDLPSGTTLARSDIETKRPPDGLSPTRYDEILGRTLVQDIARDEPFAEAHFEGL